MPVLDINIIKDTRKLISLYQTNLRFRDSFDRIVAKNINTTYQGRPIKLYVEVLANISSEYKNGYRQVRNIVIHDEEGKVGALFKRVRPRDFFLLDNAAKYAQQGINQTSYSTGDIEQINKIETGSKDRKEKGIAHTRRIDEATQSHLQLPPTPEKTLPSLKTAPTLSESRSWSGRIGKARQAISNPGEFIGSFFRRGAVEKVGVTAVTEGVTGGVVKTVATRTGTRLVAGKAAAASAGKIAAKLGINTLVKAGAGLAAKLGISALAGAFSAGVGTAIGILVTIATTFGDQTKTLFKYILLITIALFLTLFISSDTQRGIKMSALLPPYQLPSVISITPTTTTPVPTITISPGDLASCGFYRAGVSAQFNSSLLLSYFQEASQLSGVPAVLLAAITRVESPGIVSYTDASLSTFSCAVSGTGAIGLMQLQPAGTIGYCSDCINLGASYLGKTADTLTQADYCDLRKNIIIAAGFILKKAHYMTGESGNSWNPLWMTDKSYIDEVAAGYYGCLLYGGSSDCTGPYNYGTDLWTSLINCQPSAPPPITPSPGLNAFNSYFCQHNPSWASYPISSSGETMSSGGCGLTSIAMILNYFGLPYTPMEVLTKFNQNPSWYTSSGANMGSALSWVESLGFEIVELSSDTSDLEQNIPRYLSSGYLILGSQYIASPLSHIFVVSDSLPNGNVILEDPDKYCQPNLEKTVTRIMEDYSRPTYGKWMYAKAIKKVR